MYAALRFECAAVVLMVCLCMLCDAMVGWQPKGAQALVKSSFSTTEPRFKQTFKRQEDAKFIPAPGKQM